MHQVPPKDLFHSCFLPQQPEGAVHRQVSLSPILNTDALPPFSLLGMQTMSPVLAPAGFSHHVSALTQKLFGPVIPEAPREAQHQHSPARTLPEARRLELAGIPARSQCAG